MGHVAYLRRIFSAYLTGKTSHLTFWHETPEVNQNFRPGDLGEYYMPFLGKADYSGHYDKHGIPMLDYHGEIGMQYNPIAIAQFGLGNYNWYLRDRSPQREAKFLKAADWLAANLEETPYGNRVWYHHFDWEYRDTLKAPWYSALAQGQGLSVLARAYRKTGDKRYRDAACEAFKAFVKDVGKGGVVYTDRGGDVWLEEYIVFPPTHILNGFVWATWGLYDFFLLTGESEVRRLFDDTVRTLTRNLHLYDCGFWSLYEQSGTKMKMLASPFYHRLHIVQMEIMHRLTGKEIFSRYAEKWEKYRRNAVNRNLALAYKALFKLLYY